MLTAKKSTVFAAFLVLVGLLGVGIAQEGVPRGEQTVRRSDELQDLLRLLDLQERQLDLVQQQIQLTKRRIQAITERAQDGATIEIEAWAIEIVTKEDGEFERLLSLPEPGGGFPLVLDGEEFETLLSKATDAAGARVLTRPKVELRDRARGGVANLTRIPFFGADGQVAYATVGFEFSFQPRVLSAQTLALTMDVEWSKQVGQVMVTAPDGTEVPIPEISKQSKRTRVSLEKGQGVVLGGLLAMRAPEEDAELEYTHVLYFARPRVLPAGAPRPGRGR